MSDAKWVKSAKNSGPGRKLRGLRRRVLDARDRSKAAAEGVEHAPRALLDQLAELTRAKDHAKAIKLAEENLQRYGGDVAFLKQARTSFSTAGAITLHLEATRLMRELDADPKWAERERVMHGRWLETSDGWWPHIDGEPEKLEPSSAEKVLHLLKISLPYRQSGYSVRSKYSLEGELAAGLEPVAVTALGFPRGIGVAEFPSSEEIDGIRYRRLDLGPEHALDGPWDEYLTDFAQAAAEVVREERPAVIHVHSGHRGYDTALVAVALGKHFGIPVVYEVRGFFESLWTSDDAWSEQGEIYQRRFDTETRCMAAADHVVTLSESMRAVIVERGIDPDDVTVVPNGVDIEAFQPRERSTALVEKLGLADTFTFGYVSNLDHYREGQEALIEAAVQLRAKGVKATALIVGDGKRRAELEQIAEDAKAGDAVIFTGRVPHQEVLDYYALLDVFVIPRVNERAARLVTPLKPFEAMAAGIPLVTSDLEALREVTGDGERGRYFPAGDAGGLTDVLAELHADPDARKAMAEKAREWVVAERQWSANGQRYAEIYQRLLG